MKFPFLKSHQWLRTTLLYLSVLSPVCSFAKIASAFEVGVGAAAVEEGDDRMRPAVAIHGALNDHWGGRLYYYGREFGPIREDTIIFSAHRRFNLFNSSIFKAQIGAAVMDEMTKVHYSSDADKDKNEVENQGNLGAAVGISAQLPPKLAPFYAHISWDSHVFPAGLGGILLSTGRKQIISVAAGVTF